ncbi:hypothetical protein BZZ01_00165 [Nostocales cyanobacterium HT-58-2]|nr:hypothetical protein BZZ01_00165 [Nostocales cyanobacterium HT-58-2]
MAIFLPASISAIHKSQLFNNARILKNSQGRIRVQTIQNSFKITRVYSRDFEDFLRKITIHHSRAEEIEIILNSKLYCRKETLVIGVKLNFALVF